MSHVRGNSNFSQKWIGLFRWSNRFQMLRKPKKLKNQIIRSIFLCCHFLEHKWKEWRSSLELNCYDPRSTHKQSKTKMNLTRKSKIYLISKSDSMKDYQMSWFTMNTICFLWFYRYPWPERGLNVHFENHLRNANEEQKSKLLSTSFSFWRACL